MQWKTPDRHANIPLCFIYTLNVNNDTRVAWSEYRMNISIDNTIKRTWMPLKHEIYGKKYNVLSALHWSGAHIMTIIGTHSNQHNDSITYRIEALTDKFIYLPVLVMNAKVIEAIYIAIINSETPMNRIYIIYLLPSNILKSVIEPNNLLNDYPF